jgi:hypothetical protein
MVLTSSRQCRVRFVCRHSYNGALRSLTNCCGNDGVSTFEEEKQFWRLGVQAIWDVLETEGIVRPIEVLSCKRSDYRGPHTP